MKYHIKVADKRKEKTLALGVYPDLSLKDARIAAFNAKQQLKNGIDPSTFHRRTQRYEQAHARANQFLGLAEQWFNTKKTIGATATATANNDCFLPDLNPCTNYPEPELSPALIMQPLNVMLNRSAIESARRALHVLHQVLDYGCALGLMSSKQRHTPENPRSPTATQDYGAPTTPKDYHEVIRLSKR